MIRRLTELAWLCAAGFAIAVGMALGLAAVTTALAHWL